jgi:hypothetical protein
VVVTLPDFTGLSLVAFITLLVILSAADMLWNSLLAIVHKNFSSAYVADFLVSHVAMRVGPIAFLEILGNGIPAAGLPAIPAVSAVAVLGLGAYFVETVGSLVTATRTTVPITTDPSAPAVGATPPAPPAGG